MIGPGKFPHQVQGGFGLIRLIGDRYGIEDITKKWDKLIVDRSVPLQQWAEAILSMSRLHQAKDIFCYINNHYAGNGPETARQLIAELQTA